MEAHYGPVERVLRSFVVRSNTPSKAARIIVLRFEEQESVLNLRRGPGGGLSRLLQLGSSRWSVPVPGMEDLAAHPHRPVR